MSIETARGINVNNAKPKEINHKQIDDRQYIPKQYKEVAESMETQFAEAMLKQMNQTIGEEGDENGNGMDFYKSLQNTERAKMMAHQNELGLQNVILDQIYPKRMRNEAALKSYESQIEAKRNLIHHAAPSFNIDKNTDTIKMGKNDSTQEGGSQ